jgi:hypothetical protein
MLTVQRDGRLIFFFSKLLTHLVSCLFFWQCFSGYFLKALFQTLQFKSFWFGCQYLQEELQDRVALS